MVQGFLRSWLIPFALLQAVFPCCAEAALPFDDAGLRPDRIGSRSVDDLLGRLQEPPPCPADEREHCPFCCSGGDVCVLDLAPSRLKEVTRSVSEPGALRKLPTGRPRSACRSSRAPGDPGRGLAILERLLL